WATDSATEALAMPRIAICSAVRRPHCWWPRATTAVYFAASCRYFSRSPRAVRGSVRLPPAIRLRFEFAELAGQRAQPGDGVEDDDPRGEGADDRPLQERELVDLVGARGQLAVGRIQLRVGGLQLLVGGLQLLVGRLQLLVGGLQLLVRRLQLLVGRLQLLI